MNAENFSIDMLLKMAHSPVRNYIVPGLTSWLIGTPSPWGTMRLFDCTREQQEAITPHSHRFDFQCWVLRGEVRNRLWHELPVLDTSGDLYHVTTLRYGDEIGKYERIVSYNDRWHYKDDVYKAGECYSMTANEVHSICFSRGALVLFFEGPQVTESSVILEPVVDGIPISTMKVEPWMFLKGEVV